MKHICLFSIAVLALSACSTQKFVSFESPASETFSTDKLKAFLKNTPTPKLY